MEEAISFAKKYLEDVLSFFGLNVDVHATHDEDVIELNIPSTHMNGFLIGQRGDTVRALQYMVMSALKNKNHEYVRVNVDVADYKKAQNDRLAEQVELWVAEVKSKKKDIELKPMNPAYRRIVHKVSSENGLETESIGEGYDRRVVIKATGFDSESTADTDEEPVATESSTSKESPNKEGAEPKETKTTKTPKTEAKPKASKSTKPSGPVPKPRESNIKKPSSSLKAKLLRPRKSK